MRSPIAPVALTLLLAACQPPAPDPLFLGPPLQADLAPCGGNAVLPLIGRSAGALPATGPWGALRVIRPGMMITMDYSESRLNVEVDDQGRITALRCG
jgi:hypothetical protein